MWQNELNRNDCSAVVNGLNSNSTTTKIRILNKLLYSQIIDIKQLTWTDLSVSLQKCFVSSNRDIFTTTLKIHHKLVSFPNTCCEGYLNLLKGTHLLLNTHQINDAANTESGRGSRNDIYKIRILQSLRLILNALIVVLKTLLHSSRTIIDELMTAFVDIICSKSAFERISDLDPDAVWMRNICYAALIRRTFFSTLSEKHPHFIKEALASLSQDNAQIYSCFLLHFWRFNSNLTFPLEVSVENTLDALVHKINDSKELKLTYSLVELFACNPALLTSKILNSLVEPLLSSENNEYVFRIITQAAKSYNFRVLLGCSKLKKSRAAARIGVNVTQKVVDLAIALLQNTQTDVDVKTINILLTCCRSIYESHPITLVQANPLNLIQTLHIFYQRNWKTESEIRAPILSLLSFFYTSIKVAFDFDIIADLISFTPIDTLKSVISRLGMTQPGFEFLKTRYSDIVTPYLEQIWSREETGEDEHLEFVLFLFVVKMNTRSAVAFLTDDDDRTIVDDCGGNSTLIEIIEKTLSGCGETNEEYLGLLAMKVMTMNLDLLLYFQANHQMQEKLKMLDESQDDVIIDAVSCLRHSILVNLDVVGVVQPDVRFTIPEMQLIPQILNRHQNGDNELKKLLETESKCSDFSWLSQARRAFKNSLNVFDASVLLLLVEQTPKTVIYRKCELHWPHPDSVYYQLHAEDFNGISTITTFGLKKGLLHNDTNHHDNLILLIKQSRAFINHQPEHFSNFDWFLGIVYLICGGDSHKCRSVLIDFTKTQATSLVWATFGKEFDDAFQDNFYRQLDTVLADICTSFEALKMLFASPEIIVTSWLNQCFFNLLQFEEICKFLALSILYPSEYILYYVVAVFQHLNYKICLVTHSPSVENILNMTWMGEFKLEEHIILMERLAKRYRNSHKL